MSPTVLLATPVSCSISRTLFVLEPDDFSVAFCVGAIACFFGQRACPPLRAVKQRSDTFNIGGINEIMRNNATHTQIVAVS